MLMFNLLLVDQYFKTWSKMDLKIKDERGSSYNFGGEIRPKANS